MYRNMQESGLTEIIPSLCISAIWRQHPAIWFFTLYSSSLVVGSGDSSHMQLDGYQIADIVLFGLRNSHLEGQNPWWLISFFIDMAENTPFLTSKLPATCVLLALISHPISPSPSILPFSLSLAHQPFHASVPLLILVMSRGWGCLNPLAKSYPSCKPQLETEDNVGFLGTEGFLHPVSCL